MIVAVDGKSIAGCPRRWRPRGSRARPGARSTSASSPGRAARRHDVELERASVRVPAVQGRDAPGRGPQGRLRASSRPSARARMASSATRSSGSCARGAEGIVIDLRGNGGGLLNEAILASSVFVDDGTVVSTRSRTQGDRDLDAVGDALDPVPLVVLVNGDSASAAEILTAALAAPRPRDHRRHPYLRQGHLPGGHRASDGGGALDLTIGQYLTADGTSIAGKGVEPDVQAKDDPRTEGEDEGLDEALEVLGGELPSSSRPVSGAGGAGNASSPSSVAAVASSSPSRSSSAAPSRASRAARSASRAGRDRRSQSAAAAALAWSRSSAAPIVARRRGRRAARRARHRARVSTSRSSPRRARRVRPAPPRSAAGVVTSPHLPTFTVDPASAHDFDDAVSRRAGGRRLPPLDPHRRRQPPTYAPARGSMPRRCGGRRASTCPAPPSRCCRRASAPTPAASRPASTAWR